MTRLLRLVLLAWLAAVALLVSGTASGIASAQDAAATAQGPDYQAWEALAQRAEAALDDSESTDQELAELRAQVTPFREQFLQAQSANLSRINTLRNQIDALGPAPSAESGTTESAEISARRTDLNDQLTQLLTPQKTAVEAYKRADGIVSEIDRTLRERQASLLLSLGPSPLNPTTWPDAAREVTAGIGTVYQEARAQIASSTWSSRARQSAPATLFFALSGLLLLIKGRGWVDALTRRVGGNSRAAGRAILGLVLSIGQIVVTVVGLALVVGAAKSLDILGPKGTVLSYLIPLAGLVISLFAWLGARLLPTSEARYVPIPVPEERRAEGRYYLKVLGLLFAVAMVLSGISEVDGYSDPTRAVLNFPVILVAGLTLFRVGQFLIRAGRGSERDDSYDFRGAVARLTGRAAMVCGVAGPVLAAIGYHELGRMLTYPAVMTLVLLGMLLLLFLVVIDLYALATRKSDDEARQALMPVLINFGLSLAVLPVLALIWGARVTDLTELWARFREGFTIGQTHLSPGEFLTFIVVFAIGYGATRGLQATLRMSVLPRTRFDSGAQNAIVSGIGYLGLIAAAFVAIGAAGIDLSALAYVAGALSVGIGFGLQNVVQNFVAGIILLIERPIAEGDWIEVGGQMGFVRGISVRSTRIETFDRTDVIVPNADFISNKVTNYTRSNLLGRITMSIGVAYGSDTRRVEAILREIVEAHPLVTVDPAPSIVFAGFGESSLNFEIRAILSDVNFSLATRSEINHQVAARFAAEGIEIPFPQRDVWIRGGGGPAGPVPSS